VRFFHLPEGPKTHALSADVGMSDSDGKSDPDASNDRDTKAEEEWHYRSGLYLVSGGYDGLVKIWSADDWQLLRTLTTDASKVMSVDFSSDTKLLASATYNRNFQLFAGEDNM
jgi:U4/U6 small nuclear ribonucleoprotein PRP4